MKRKIIGTLYRNGLKPLLFKRDPDFVHHKFCALGHSLGKYSLFRGLTGLAFAYNNPKLEQTVDGIKFPNPVGLSAGFDKEAEMIPILPKVGFGFLQIGSVTLEPYEGNKGKRAVRLKKSQGIIVNYGLKNKGIKNLVNEIPKEKACKVPISVSIAKTNCPQTAVLENGLKDYLDCIKFAEEHQMGDFYTINISCPNTADGEPFSTPKTIDLLLSGIDGLEIKKPVYLKMPIDKSWEEYEALLEVIAKHKVQGLVIGNLLKDRTSKDIIDPIPEGQKGGISGKPTEKVCNELIFKTYQKYKDRFTIVGVGGIFSAEDAYHKSNSAQRLCN